MTNFSQLDNRALGAAGESLVAGILQADGWEIVARNVRVGRFELDIIATDADGRLHVIEVKTRRGNNFGDGREAITDQKLRHLRVASARWLAKQDRLWTGGIAIDCAEVTVLGQTTARVDFLEEVSA
ncbi:MAG: YraN family protein [Corynebacterium sp.]|uniref:YraN family protein n=1 Tax=Corynebacterium sp. TaxID=1720 RepID=UPI0026DAB0A7|nr:YraN family protein [Corynebacterium sp.]MDO5029292.1 YraN family protein [Corynebacterium sp.]